MTTVYPFPLSNSGNVGPADPGVDFYAVTPSDTVDLPNGPCRALLLNQDATVFIDPPGRTGFTPNTNVALTLVKGWNPCAAKRVRASGLTGGTTIVAVY